MNTKTSNTKLTTAEFIERGINRFGDFFDYTKSIYSGMTNKVTIRSIKEPSVSFEKVGLTVSISSRFGSLKRDGVSYEILNSVVLPVQLAIQLEEDILSDLNSINKAYKIHHLKGTKTKGWTECFPCGSIDIKQKIMEYVDDNNYHT